MNQSTEIETADTGWKVLYIIGGAAALLAVLFFRRNCGVELVTFNGFGIWDAPALTPITAAEWFALFQSDPFVSLVLFGLIDLINYALVGVIFLALYGALRQVNKSAMVIAAAFGLIGSTVYFASNQAFAMLNLSHHFAGAATDEQRAMFLAAGEALLAIFNPGLIYQGTGYYIGLLLVLVAGLIISIVMLQSKIFSRWTAYAGILANGIGLGYFLALIFIPTILWLPPSLSAPFRMLWYVLVAIGLLRLARSQT